MCTLDRRRSLLDAAPSSHHHNLTLFLSSNVLPKTEPSLGGDAGTHEAAERTRASGKSKNPQGNPPRNSPRQREHPFNLYTGRQVSRTVARSHALRRHALSVVQDWYMITTVPAKNMPMGDRLSYSRLRTELQIGYSRSCKMRKVGQG